MSTVAPDKLEQLLYRAAKTQDPDKLRERLRERDEIQRIKAKLGPQNKDELWQWFKDRIGIELARVAVCPGHSSQLDMVWEVYSFEVHRVLWVMARGGGKTSLVSWLDECQAEHFPGWAAFCVPLDAEILTRRGWLTVDQLEVGHDETIGFNPETGRSEWTMVKDKNVFRDRSTQTISNKLWSARVTQGHTWSVVDRGYRSGPKGPGTEEKLKSIDDMLLNDKVRLAATAEGGELDVSPAEARVIGWLWGDGNCQTRMIDGERRTYVWGEDPDDALGKAKIYQSKPEGLAQIQSDLEGIPHTEARPRAAAQPHHHEQVTFSIDPAWMRDVLKRARIGRDGLWAFIGGLSVDARGALLSGFVAAEGWTMKDTRYDGPGTICFAQNEGPILDALVFCSYLCGYRPTFNANDRSELKANAKNWQVMLCKPYSYAGRLKVGEFDTIEDVWCPTTGLGTWTMRWQGQVLLTGNTIGANQQQGDYKYRHMLPLVVEGGVIGGKELEHVLRSIATITELKNGSSIEIAKGGTPESANGPRVPRLHRDETELMRADTYKQAGNIPAGRKLRDGRYAPAQMLDTSTMKWAGGKIDTMMREYREAKEKGYRPRMEVRICCIYELASENPACRSAPAELREARLRELGRDPDALCDCDTYVQDVWPSEDGTDGEDTPRTLESVCNGRFFRSRGYKGFDDVHSLFQENPRETWEAELECSEPSREGAYIKSYNEVRHGIKGYRPDPQNGPIYSSTDWGTTDEAAHIWFQELEREVVVKGYVSGEHRTLPAGAIVAFAEVYRAGLGNTALGKVVQEREAEWIMEFPGWHVTERYADNANPGAAQDWKHELGMPIINRIRKDFVEEVKYVRTRVGSAGAFFMDIAGCPKFHDAIRAWRQENGREVHDWSSHHMAAFRYFEHNRHVVERKTKRAGNARGNAPAAAADGDERVREREKEMSAMRSKRPRMTGDTIEIIGVKPDSGYEDMGVAGAETSPVRVGGLSIGGEGDWRAGFGGHER